MDRNLELFQRLALSTGTSLAHAALFISRLEYPDLDLSRYLDWFERQGSELARMSHPGGSVVDRIQVLNLFIYAEHGFRPNTENYYDPKNSYLNDVIERRLGIPISLAVVYIELARYLNLELEGVAFPWHFLIRNMQTRVFYIDAFDYGQILSREDCENRFVEATQGHLTFNDDYLRPASKIEVLVRMLGNLKNVFVKQDRLDRAVEALNWAIAVQPDTILQFRDRGLLLARMEYPEAAMADLQHYLDHQQHPEEREKIAELLQALRGRRTTIH
ncbi:MAG: tetratricopeptide repeat protein [Acidobacteria bacterium]|nr:tetratricopeptide repeat protein [Acidobacteriota bacterium]